MVCFVTCTAGTGQDTKILTVFNSMSANANWQTVSSVSNFQISISKVWIWRNTKYVYVLVFIELNEVSNYLKFKPFCYFSI